MNLDTYGISFFPFSEHTILIRFSYIDQIELTHSILSVSKHITQERGDKLTECIPTYSSLLLYYKLPISNISYEIQLLTKLLANWEIQPVNYRRIWKIPVCYHEPFGEDLGEVSQKLSLSTDAIVSLHTSISYVVCFMGFLPGFPYLYGLPSELHIPRRKFPKPKISGGSVALAAGQTGIYTIESPGGWYVIGKTPIRFFDVGQQSPCFLEPGDQIQFKAINTEEYQRLEKQPKNKNFLLPKIVNI